MGLILRVLNMTEKCLCRNKDTGSHAELVQGVAMVSNMVVRVPTAMTAGSSPSRIGSLKSVSEMGASPQVIVGRKALRGGRGQEARLGEERSASSRSR